MTMTRRAVYFLKRFDPSLPLKVGKPFKLSGRDFKTGESFDRSLATTRTMRQLYEQRRLVVDEQGGAGMVDKPAPLQEPKIEPVCQHAPLSTRHSGHGKYRVYRGDDPVSEPLPKDEAEALHAKLAA